MAKTVKSSPKPQNPTISNAKNLGAWIKYKRTKAKLTVKECAGLCNINERTFSNIEKGHSGTSILKYLEVASALGITIEIKMENDYE